MRITKVELSKEFKKGLPQYSNITIGMRLSVDIPENEEPDYNSLWDIIDQQLTIQSSGIDASWIKHGETQDSFKLSIKVPKKGGEK